MERRLTDLALKSVKIKNFRLVLTAVFLLALTLRILYAWQSKQLRIVQGDDDWYHAMANAIADGKGYIKPFVIDSNNGFQDVQGSAAPTGWHPPLFPGLLALFSLLGFDSFVDHQIVTCFLGATTAVVVALAARVVAGEKVAVVAGILTALYPQLIMDDSVLMSESLFGLLSATTLLMALKAVDSGYKTRKLVLVGLFAGLVALTRSEGSVLLLLFALVFIRQDRSWQLKRTAVVLATGVLIISPWVVRNWTVLGEPTLATSHGLAITGSNCDEVYYGRHIGFFSHSCPTQRDPLSVGLIANIPGKEDEIAQTNQWRSDGLDYAKKHLDRLPLVMVVRVLRTWQLYKPFEQQHLHAFLFSHSRSVSIAATWAYFLMVLLAAVALIRKRVQQEFLVLLLVPVVFVTIVSLLSYGAVRLREGAEPSILVLAAVGLWGGYTVLRGKFTKQI